MIVQETREREIEPAHVGLVHRGANFRAQGKFAAQQTAPILWSDGETGSRHDRAEADAKATGFSGQQSVWETFLSRHKQLLPFGRRLGRESLLFGGARSLDQLA